MGILAMAPQVLGAVGEIAGAIGNIGAGRRQYHRQKKLMGIQMQNQQTLNAEAYEKQKDFWEHTNYPAQIEQLKKAGLNVGLMYEGQGGQGATGSMPTGSATGGSAAQDIPIQSGMGMQLGMMKSQLELQAAQADKLRAEAENLRGADRENTQADTSLKKMQTANQEIVNNVQGQTVDEQILAIKANADTAQSEARQKLVGANISEETQQAQENTIKNMAIASALEAGLKQSNINLNEAQIKNMAEQISIGKFNANREAEFQGIDKVAGSQLNKLINKIYEIFGIKEETNTQKQLK